MSLCSRLILSALLLRVAHSHEEVLYCRKVHQVILCSMETWFLALLLTSPGRFTVFGSFSAQDVGLLPFANASVIGNAALGSLFLTFPVTAKVNGSLAIRFNSSLVLMVPSYPAPGSSVTLSIFEYGSLSGAYASITAKSFVASPSNQCPSTVVASYGPSTLAVTISTPVSCDSRGLSDGALAGIIVGGVVGGVALAILIVVVSLGCRNSYTTRMNRKLRQKELERV